MPHDPGDIGLPQIPSADQIFAKVADTDFDIGPSVGVDPDLTFLVPDDFLIVGGKTFDVRPLATDVDGDGVDDGDTVDEIVVPGVRRDPAAPEIPEVDQGGGPGYGDGSGGGGSGADPLSDLFDWITEQAGAALQSLLESFADSPSDLAERDDKSTFDRNRASPLYRNGQFVGYIDNANPQDFWLDRNGNGQPETLLRYFPGGEIWQDTNFDGSFDRRVR